MSDSTPPETMPTSEPRVELSSPGESIAQTVQVIGTTDSEVAGEIQQAHQEGLVDTTQVQNLQQERMGCLTTALSAVSRAIPTRLKPYLHAALQKGTLDKAYIWSLNPQRDAAELNRLAELYQNKIGDAFHARGSPQERLVRAELATDHLIAALERKEFDEESRYFVDSAIIGIAIWSQDDVSISVQDRARLGRKVAEFGMRKGTQDAKIAILKEYVRRFDDDPSSLLVPLPPEEKLEAVSSILREIKYAGGIFSRGDYAFNLLNGLEPEQRKTILPTLMDQVSSLPEEGGQRVSTAKRILSYATEDSRKGLIEQTGRQWRDIIKTDKSQEQLDRITDLTDRPEEQDIIFWAVESVWKDYRGHPRFDVNAAVARAEPDGLKTYFVTEQMRTNFLSAEAIASYGSKIISQKMGAEKIDVGDVLAIARIYGVDISSYRNRLLGEIESSFRSGSLTRESAEMAHKIGGSVELATEWEAFRYDVQATPEFGEKTWRREQSIIDTLQNHLDANDFKYAYQLVEAALGKQEAEHLLANGRIKNTMNQLYKFKERYPIPEKQDWHYDVQTSHPKSGFKPQQFVGEFSGI